MYNSFQHEFFVNRIIPSTFITIDKQELEKSCSRELTERKRKVNDENNEKNRMNNFTQAFLQKPSFRSFLMPTQGYHFGT